MSCFIRLNNELIFSHKGKFIKDKYSNGILRTHERKLKLMKNIKILIQLEFKKGKEESWFGMIREI